MKLKVTAKNIPGLSKLVLYKNNTVQSFSGLLFDIWNEIAKSNGYNYDVLLGDQEIVGGADPKNPGNWSGMIGMLMRHEADVIVAPVSVTAARAEVIEFSMPLYEDATCVLTSATSNKDANKFLTLFRPFDYLVWIFIVSLAIVYSLTLYAIHRLLTRKSSKFVNESNKSECLPPTLIHYFFFVFGKLLMQDLNIQQIIYLKSERLLLFFWWLFGIIINSLYTSVLVSLLVITKYEPEINSVSDLAKLKGYKLCMQSGGYQIEYFNKATNPTYKEIYDYIQDHKTDMNYISSAAEIFEKSFEGKCYGFVDHMVGSVLLGSVKAQNISCVDYWAPASIAFAYRKNWIHAKNISTTITKLHENGIISLIINNYLNPLSKQKTTQVNDNVVISLDNLFSIFVLHALFMLFSIIVQIIQIAWKRQIFGRIYKTIISLNERKKQ